MAATSSNPFVTVEVAEEYPYPSHVCAPNFVTVKLTGKDKYNVWKTQMLCLLVSHGMLGFIDGRFVSSATRAQSSVSGKEKAGDIEAWIRSDALVKGWILGSLSEQALTYVLDRLTEELHLQTNTDFTAKDVWDKLRSIYGPAVLHNYGIQQDQEEEKKTGEAKSIEEYPISKDPKAKNEAKTQDVAEDEDNEKKKEAEERAINKKKKEAKEIAMIHQALYEATLAESWFLVDDILLNKKVPVTVTDKITINGSTALHVAVGTTKNKEFVEKMLGKAPESNLLDMRNSDGSTLLHVAAIVGNTDAAKILVGRNPELLFAKDKEGCTPLARALSNMHTNTYLYLLNPTNTFIEMGTLLADRSGDELLVNAISSKDFDSAQALLQNCSTLHSDAVLIAIAQNFPRELKNRERIVNRLREFSQDKADKAIEAFEDQIRCHKFWKFLLYTCGLGAIYLLFLAVFRGILMALVWPFKSVEERIRIHDDADYLLYRVCRLIRDSKDSRSHHHYYTNPVLEATRQNAYEVVEGIVYYFPNAIWSVNEDRHNIIQYAVINRSEKVYNLLYQMSEHKNIYRTIKDSSENNLLHLAGRLAPTNKLNLISGAALQIQRELQWFKEVEGFVCPLNIIQKNSFEETPQMVFTREHKELVIEGEKWMKATAESYTITAALITTIVFAAAITVPGGNNQVTGIPIFTNEAAFTIFAVSDAISLFTSTTSLLMFLSILTARFAEQDFLYKLPKRLIIGLATLFISTTAMIVAFGATLFLVFGQRKSWILIPIAALTCLPITSFVTLQFPLIADLMSATYGRSIFGKKRDRPFY